MFACPSQQNNIRTTSSRRNPPLPPKLSEIDHHPPVEEGLLPEEHGGQEAAHGPHVHAGAVHGVAHEDLGGGEVARGVALETVALVGQKKNVGCFVGRQDKVVKDKVSKSLNRDFNRG